MFCTTSNDTEVLKTDVVFSNFRRSTYKTVNFRKILKILTFSEIALFILNLYLFYNQLFLWQNYKKITYNNTVNHYNQNIWNGKLSSDSKKLIIGLSKHVIYLPNSSLQYSGRIFQIRSWCIISSPKLICSVIIWMKISR